MPKSRQRRIDPDDGFAYPGEREELIAKLEAKIRPLRRKMIQRKWTWRQAERAAGRPSIGLPLVPFTEPKVAPRYGTNNPLRYQETSKDPPRLDLRGSRL